MSEPAARFPWFSGERKLTGTARLLLGFIVGALFGLLPIYYFYMGREAVLRSAAGPHPLVIADAGRTVPEPSPTHAGASKPFASRMTYELSQLPEEPPPVKAAGPAPQPAAAQAAPRAERAAATVSGQSVPTARVVNARPIVAAPLDPRDTTREIVKETRRPDYREPAAADPEMSAAEKGSRVAAVREAVSAKIPAAPTRPIVARAAGNSRREIEAERIERPPPTKPRAPAVAPAPAAAAKPAESRAVIASAPVTGVTPITRPPETAPRADAATPGAAAVAPRSAEDPVAGRLAATREWLASAPQTTHTIQLLGSSSEERLKTHLKSLSKVLEPSKIYVFRTVAQGKPSLTVAYGAYADRSSALRALEKLPPAVTANRPVLRTVNGIRAEMRQHGTSG